VTGFIRGDSVTLPAGAWTYALSVLALVVVVSGTASAQDPPVGAAPPVGQDVPPDDPARPPIVPKIEPRRLNLSTSVFGAYDMTAYTDAQPGLLPDQRISQNESFTGVSASLNFSGTGHNKTLSALTGTDLRYYSTLPTVLPVDYFGGLSFSSMLSRRVSVRVSGAASYAPYYAFGSFLTPVEANGITTPEPERAITRLDTFSSDASGTLIWSPARRMSVETRYAIDDVSTPALAYQLRSQSAGGTLRTRTSRYTELRVGYAYRTSDSGLAAVPKFVAQDIDAGIGYHRPLSFSRRTVIGIDFGTTVVSQQGTNDLFVTGDASLAYQLRRTWTAALFAHRDVSTIGGIAIPFASNVVSGTLGGLWSRHVAVSVNGSYARGSSAIAVSNGYQLISGSSRLSFRLSRYLPAYVEYVYYHYRFENAFGLAPGFPLVIDRTGVRSGLAYSLPVVGRRVPQS
jgi:hypothetical protein